jgi:GNAT superfamily N-acetyltransferase
MHRDDASADDFSTPLEPGRMRTTVTLLSMDTRPAPRRRTLPSGRFALLRAERCSVPYYRFLYDTVGENWLWWFRRAMDDAALRAILENPDVEVHVLLEGGTPAGYVELDWRTLTDETGHAEPGLCRIAYLGLMPDCIGRGLGRWLLDWAVEAAWARAGVQRLEVDTCTLDHPSALSFYQKAGFSPLRRWAKEEADPRAIGLIPRHAAPHVPLTVG